MTVKLDLGCGPHRRPGYLGLDLLNEKNLDIIGDAHNLPLRNNVLAEIISTKVMEHLNNPYQVLSECKRVIKKRCKIIIGVPNIHTLRRSLRWAVKGKISVGAHIYAWGLPEIINLGKSQGLKYRGHYFDTYTRYHKHISAIEKIIRRFNGRIIHKNLNVVFSVA